MLLKEKKKTSYHEINIIFALNSESEKNYGEDLPPPLPRLTAPSRKFFTKDSTHFFSNNIIALQQYIFLFYIVWHNLSVRSATCRGRSRSRG